MAWYRTGTIALTNASAVVNGTGTAWVANALPGDILSIPGAVLEVKRIVSDTQLELVLPYSGATAAGVGYALVPTQGYVPTALQTMQQILAQFGDIWQAWQAGDLQGRGLALKGAVDEVEELPAEGNAAGDGYIVDGSKLYVWNGTAWAYAGEMVTTAELLQLRSDVADNAVQVAADKAAAMDAAARAEGGATVVMSTINVQPSVATALAETTSGQVFTILPGGPDGFNRTKTFLNDDGVEKLILSPVPGEELDQYLAPSGLAGLNLRDGARRAGALLGPDGALRSMSSVVGRPFLKPSRAIRRAAMHRLADDLGGQSALFSEHRAWIRNLRADRINGVEAAYWKPNPVRVLADSRCGCLPSAVAGWKGNVRKRVRFPGGGRGIQFHWANSFWVGEQGGYPAGFVPTPYTLSASVLYNGTRRRITFGGAASVTVHPGRTVACDPLPFALDPTASLDLFQFVDPGPGGVFPLGPPMYPGVDGMTYSAGDFDQTMNPGYDYPSWTGNLGPGINMWGPIGFGPIGITGHAKSPAFVVGMIGDSIGQGAADAEHPDAGFGWAARALSGRELVFINLSQQSEQAATVLDEYNAASRWPWLEYLNAAICEYGRNDFNAWASAAEMQARCISLWRRAGLNGAQVYQTTCTPRASSTDGFATVANQTPWVGENPGGTNPPSGPRTQFNDWLRDGAPLLHGQALPIGSAVAVRAGQPWHPLAGVIDVADVVESSRNSCRWRVDLGQPTTDDIHPSSVLHAAIAQIVPTHLFN